MLRGTDLRNSRCVSLKSGQVLIFWRVFFVLWSESFWHLSQHRSGRFLQKQTLSWELGKRGHNYTGQADCRDSDIMTRSVFTCEWGCCSDGWCVRGWKGATILLMGEKHLKVIVLLLAEAADVDVWAHLHNNRMPWWESRKPKSQIRDFNRKFLNTHTHMNLEAKVIWRRFNHDWHVSLTSGIVSRY